MASPAFSVQQEFPGFHLISFVDKEILNGAGDGRVCLEVDLRFNFAVCADLADEIAADDLRDAQGEFFPGQRPYPVKDEDETIKAPSKSQRLPIFCFTAWAMSCPWSSISDSGKGL